MVKPKSLPAKRRTFLISVAVLLLVTCLIFLAIKYDSRRANQYELEAAAVGVIRAKQECLKEGKSNNICESITGSASHAECYRSNPCWIVYAFAEDRYAYNADMFVKLENGQYVVSDFGSGKVTPLEP